MCRAEDELPDKSQSPPSSFTRKSAELLVLSFGPLLGVSVADLDVEVDEMSVEISGPYSLTAKLPLDDLEECDEDEVTCQWDKRERTLRLMLPIRSVQPPPDDAVKLAEEEAAKLAEEEAAAITAAEQTEQAEIAAMTAEPKAIQDAREQAGRQRATIHAAAQAEAAQKEASRLAQENAAMEAAEARLLSAQTAAAAAANDKTCAQRDKRAASLKEEGNKLYKAKNYNCAIGKYTDAMELGVLSDAELQLAILSNRAACYMMVEKFQEAVNDCEAAIGLDNSSVKAQLRAGKCYLRLGELQRAEQAYTRVKQLAPRNKVLKTDLKSLKAVQGRFERAKMFHNKGEYGKVVPNLIAVLEECTAAATIRTKLARALMSQGKYSEASNAVMPILEKQPKHACALAIRGETLYYSCISDMERPCEVLKTAFQLDPDDDQIKQLFTRAKQLQAAKDRGNAAFKSGEYAEAVDAYKEALAVDPLHKLMVATLYSNIAAAYMKQKNWNEAVHACNNALEASAKNQKALLRRAQSYTELEQHVEAVTDYESLIQLDEKNREYRQALRQAKLKVKQGERKDYYKILGVEKNASEPDIRKAFKKAAIKCHPDKVSPDQRQEAEDKFKELNEAHEVLTNKEARHRYDTGQDIEMEGGMGGFGCADVGDIFAQFFGGGMSGFSQGGGGGRMGGHGFTFHFV